MSRFESITIREVESSDLETFYEHQLDPEAIRMAAFVCEDPTDKSNNEQATPMKVMKRKIEVSSLLLGAFTGAVAVLCVAAATTKINAGASGDTTTKAKEFQM